MNNNMCTGGYRVLINMFTVSVVFAGVYYLCIVLVITASVVPGVCNRFVLAAWATLLSLGRHTNPL